ncbi:hypothetical protein FRB99_004176 [Tulasnella sp. 403]|nr:hypothetical protein FRB99_004176 [Tulasnella sp. 403]
MYNLGFVISTDGPSISFVAFVHSPYVALPFLKQPNTNSNRPQAIVPIYRLTVLHHRTTSLNVLGTPPSSPLYPPDSLTTTPSKVTFYLFHCLPELIIATYIQSMNLRAVFNTGPFGDWGLMDKGFGIPQLRQNGVYVDGVGVPKKKKTTKRRERGEESPNTEEVVYDGDAKTEKETPQVTVVEVPLHPLVSQAS